MAQRTRKTAMPFREGLTTYLQDQICNRVTLHLDVWLYQQPDDQMYFVARAATAGHDVINVMTWRVDRDGLYAVANIQDIERTGLARHIDGPWARKHAPWLRASFQSHLLPLAQAQLPYGFKRRSVRLWCVYTNRAINDPLEGIDNLYGTTGRAARDDAFVTEKPEAARTASLWTARERSMLRTLQKILS